MTLHFDPLHPLFAAEVVGLDLSAPLPDATSRALREALRTHRLLVFRGPVPLRPPNRSPSPAASARRSCTSVAGLRSPDRPEIVLEAGAPTAANGFGLGDLRWHADLSYTPRPNRVSALHARCAAAGGRRHALRGPVRRL